MLLDGVGRRLLVSTREMKDADGGATSSRGRRVASKRHFSNQTILSIN
jgi:hypothetical protein